MNVCCAIAFGSSFVRKASIVTCFALLCLFAVGLGGEARADPQVSISMERIGGVTYSSFAPHAANGSLTVTTLGVGGVPLNPVAIPRIGVDYILPSGLTLGGAVGFSTGWLASNPNGGSSQTDSANEVVIMPRIGYRLPLGPRLDFVPRAGVTFVSGSESTPSQNCAVDVNDVTTCTEQANGASIFAIALSADVSVALRLTDSFNLLGGVAYDQVLSISASSTGGSGSTNADASGTYFGLQAWLGLGGYL